MGLASSPRFRQVSTYEGTELVKGAQGQDSSLTRRFIYVVSRENRIDGPDLLQNAQEDYIREFGFFDRSQPLLPLVQFRARQISKNLIECYATYRGQERPTVGGGTVLAEFETVAAPRKVFAHANGEGDEAIHARGLPFGRLMNGKDITAELTTEEVTACPSDVVVHRLIRIKVQRQVFGQNPLATINFLPSTTGGGSISGYNFENGTLLFEGITSQASTIGTTDPQGQTPPESLLYTYSVSFLYDPFGFPAQAFNEDGRLLIVNQYQNGGWQAFI